MKNNEKSLNGKKEIIAYWQVIITDITPECEIFDRITKEDFSIVDLAYLFTNRQINKIIEKIW